MYEYQLTIGLNDRKTKKQHFTVAEAHDKLTKILLNHFNIYAFTQNEKNFKKTIDIMQYV